MSVTVTIDILAVVKQALREPDVRNEIRAIVQEVVGEPSPLPERFVDTEAAAEFLAMSPAALRMAAFRGTIPCSRMGRRLRFRLSDLATWVAEPARMRRRQRAPGA